MLGVLSSKLGAPEDKKEMIEKVHQAAKIMAKGSGQTEQEALERIAISAQCGFAVSKQERLIKRLANAAWTAS